MTLHRNAKLEPAGRLPLVTAIEGGMSLKGAAAAFSVSPATAHRWWHRWREAGAEARQTLSCLCDRSSRPQHSPRELDRELQERICALDRLEGALPGGDLAPATAAQRACQQLRVALPGRPAAHGRQSLCPLRAARACRHRRPLTALAQLDGARDARRL